MSTADMISKIEALKKWEQLAAEAAAEIESLKDSIKREIHIPFARAFLQPVNGAEQQRITKADTVMYQLFCLPNPVESLETRARNKTSSALFACSRHTNYRMANSCLSFCHPIIIIMII